MIAKLVPASMDMRFADIGLNQQMLPVFLGILLAAALAWIFLSRRLYDALKYDYPKVYKTMGSPKLVMKKSLVVNYRVVMFLFRRGYESTDDVDLIRLCQGLRYIIIIYIICFLACLLLLVDKIL